MSSKNASRRRWQPLDFHSKDLRGLARLLDERFPAREADVVHLLELRDYLAGPNLYDAAEPGDSHEAVRFNLQRNASISAPMKQPRLAPPQAEQLQQAPPEVELPELDPRLARQTVSLRHFSLATRQYMIRFQDRFSHFKIEDFSAEIGINKSYYYKILNCERRPSRDTAIAMAVCLGLTAEETQDYLLLLGDRLNDSVKRDFLILECIRRGYSVDQTDSVLIHFDASPLVDA